MWSPFTCIDSTRRRGRWHLGCLIGMLLCAALPAQAAPLEKLLMPGPLTEAHAKYEDDCAQCHKSFSRSIQQQQCRDCHDKVSADIDSKRGFHGLSPQVASLECRQCHTEHKGRKADIVGLSPALFDHAVTDFALEGLHGKVPCADCHVAGKPMRDAPHACNDCHQKDDVHKGQMKDQCQDCHSAKSWRKSEFDHSQTHFPLKDSHRDVACASCHPDRRYKDTPTACASCHGLQDRHGGLFGDRCADCHGAKDWKSARFDHSKTKFPLLGRHRSADCHSCHTEQTRNKTLPTQCIDCHRGSDVHQGRFGRACDSCHSVESWSKKSFDHDRETQFPLQGPHRTVGCSSCHAGAMSMAGKQPKSTPARACVDCHRVDDVHHGQQGDRCDACHQVKSWREGVKFDHDLTLFPLVGLHATASCNECHLDSNYRATATTCNSCHKTDDPHRGAFGTQCQSCHNPAGWQRWTFDHDKQTDFPLEGRHQQAQCESCHKPPVAHTDGIKLDRSCNSCHASDDAHHGGFGKNCERCHQPSAFGDVRIGPRAARTKEAQ
ncbi:cytochrome C [Sinimarinibacterium sp. CAU 1509]|uniref:cytochrome c3 family protein n=1 Tax=Sinimarinibacterium sp. CAU 1509 TaxID=2562283 RepID=UPI0010AD9B28|nr:cytochrome c3 family protein [Sinimarinibacterium sp. CAU 1509]TJY59444.1 cytochrome C [Sinimarinibacterium sp. CAU 1509]